MPYIEYVHDAPYCDKVVEHVVVRQPWEAVMATILHQGNWHDN